MTSRVLLVDADDGLLSIRNLRLLMEGYEVRQVGDCAGALALMESFQPDVVVLDPDLELPAGSLLASIRREPRYDETKLIVNSARELDGECRFCLEHGADAFLAKPTDHARLVQTIRGLLRGEVALTFWGTRGSIARPGVDTLKFGGNTPCVQVELPRDRHFIFDAGTGLAELGRALAREPRRQRFNLFLSHCRWERIQGLPFFQPLLRPGNEMVVRGPRQARQGLRDAVCGQMDEVVSPPLAREFASPVEFEELEEGSVVVDGLRVDTLLLDHPGRAFGYRLHADGGRSIAYAADNEVRADGDPRARRRLAEFVQGVDVLIHDATYFDHEYRFRAGRGRSAVGEVLKLAAEARVKSLYLFHHDPHHDDAALTSMEEMARNWFAQRAVPIQCSAAREGEVVRLEGRKSGSQPDVVKIA